MTYEEVIENLQYLISNDCTETQHDFVEEIEMAIKALEKQIPKKVDKYSRCPSCGYDATNQADNDYNFEYCYHCGQALDWSDT